ncbi:MAG: sigma-70 family RNA polymerase sigma factor [Fimbriimonadales bacterium]|nr:sigma-70 family RNA polymerase sigma factor [Fimbriimonadales bacterium]
MAVRCDYQAMNELVLRAQQGDEGAAEQVLTLFRPLVQSLAGRFYMPSCEPEDVSQIALVGLWRAVLCFDPTRQAGFAAFARVCIRRQIVSELRRMQRLSAPTVSLSDDAQGRRRWLEQLPDPSQNLLERLDEQQSVYSQWERVRTRLSPLETQVAALYQQQLTYRQIAERLGCSLKAVDNALARIKRKARRQERPHL